MGVPVPLILTFSPAAKPAAKEKELCLSCKRSK
jgi:hypothetical protein